MEVGNEDAAPEAPPEVAQVEPEATRVDPPAPAPTVAPPDPAAPAALPDAKADEEDEALVFRPSPLRRLVVTPFWAGVLGSGAGLWLAGMLGASASAGLLTRSDLRAWVWLVPVGAVLAAMVGGYREPVRSYAGLVGRFFGALFFGSLWSLVTVFILVVIAHDQSSRDRALASLMTLAGALWGGLALARVHGIGADPTRRKKIAAAALAVLFVSLWPVSPSLRCRLGFGEGCRDAADTSYSAGDLHAAGASGARGCADEDGVSCRLAGMSFAEADGKQQDLRRAEGFFREGCALGDAVSCERIHAIELEQRCARYGAFACVELAQAHASGDGAPRDEARARRFYRKACLLGADEACARAGGR